MEEIIKTGHPVKRHALLAPRAFIALWLVIAAMISPLSFAGTLRVGTAAVDITPPEKMPFQVPQRSPHPAP